MLAKESPESISLTHALSKLEESIRRADSVIDLLLIKIETLIDAYAEEGSLDEKTNYGIVMIGSEARDSLDTAFDALAKEVRGLRSAEERRNEAIAQESESGRETTPRHLSKSTRKP